MLEQIPMTEKYKSWIDEVSFNIAYANTNISGYIFDSIKNDYLCIRIDYPES